MTSDKAEKARRHRLWKEAQANAAIEGINFTESEEDAFAFIIEQGLTEEQSVQYLKDVFYGRVTPPPRKTGDER